MQWLVQQSCLPNGKEWGSMPKSPSSLSALKQWYENKDCFRKLMRPFTTIGAHEEAMDWISLVYTNICNQRHSGTIKRLIKEKSDPIRSCFQFCCCCLWSTNHIVEMKKKTKPVARIGSRSKTWRSAMSRGSFSYTSCENARKFQNPIRHLCTSYKIKDLLSLQSYKSQLKEALEWIKGAPMGIKQNHPKCRVCSCVHEMKKEPQNPEALCTAQIKEILRKHFKEIDGCTHNIKLPVYHYLPPGGSKSSQSWFLCSMHAMHFPYSHHCIKKDRHVDAEKLWLDSDSNKGVFELHI